jgi:hypothetical protein
MAVLHVHWPDELPAGELVGLLIGHAHSRGYSVEHDGGQERLAIYSAAAPAAAPADAGSKVSSMAQARQRRAFETWGGH